MANFGVTTLFLLTCSFICFQAADTAEEVTVVAEEATAAVIRMDMVDEVVVTTTVSEAMSKFKGGRTRLALAVLQTHINFCKSIQQVVDTAAEVDMAAVVGVDTMTEVS